MVGLWRAPIVIATLAATALAGGQTETAAPSAGDRERPSYTLDPSMAHEAEGVPVGGLRITVSIYSGRPNPTWTLDQGTEFQRTVALIRRLSLKPQRLFDYEEWNRLGYASFWIESRGIAGVPSRLHVWRDMAYAPPAATPDQGKYATGATKLYDELVAAAERRDVRDVFRVYHGQRKQR